MAAGPGYIGITEESADVLIQSVEIERKLDIDVVRKDSSGGFGAAHAADPINVFSVTILGTSDEEVGVALAMTLTSLSGGKSVVTDKSYKKTNDNFDETTISGEHAPGASVPA
jgi:hypothetical protein